MKASSMNIRAALLLAAMLAGCGGSSDSNPVEPPVYGGNTSPATISAATVPGLADISIDALLLVAGLGGEVLEETSTDGNVDVTLDGPVSGTVNVKGSIRNGRGTLTFTYRSFTDIDLVVNGQEAIEILAQQTGPQGVYNTQLRRTFNGLSVNNGGAGAYTLGGSLAITQSPIGPSSLVMNSVITGEITLASSAPARQARINGITLTRTWRASTFVGESEVAIEGSARVYDSVAGYLDLQVQSPLLLQEMAAATGPAHGGSVMLTGASGARFWISPLTRELVALELDANADGTPDRTLSYRWADEFSRPATNRTGPVAISGPDRELRGTGNPGAVVLEGRFSENSSNTFLSQQWSLVLGPPGSNVTLTGADTSRATFTPDLNGTYLFRLLSSDGTTSSFDYLTVTVSYAPGTQANFENRRGAVIVMEPDLVVAPGTSVRLDGSRSFTPDGFTLQNSSWRWLDLGTSADPTVMQGDSATITATDATRLAAFWTTRQFSSGLVTVASQRLLPPTNRRMAPTVQLPGLIPDQEDTSQVIGVADFNGDGSDDFVMVRTDPTVPGLAPLLLRVVLGASDGRLRQFGGELTMPGSYTGLLAARIAIGDINGDSRPDIVAPGNPGIGYFLQTGNASTPFGSYQQVTAPCSTSALQLVDADADADLDVLAWSDCSASRVLLLSNTGGAFSSGAPATFDGTSPNLQAFVTLDMNADGRPDMLAVGALNDTTAWLSTATPGAYVAGPAIPPELGNMIPPQTTPLVADVDGNGLHDLIVDARAVQVIYQTTPGRFRRSIFQELPIGDSPIALRDFDGDNRKDVLATSGWYRQTPTGEFPWQPYSRGTAVLTGDFNGDGRPDLIEHRSMITLQAPPPNP
jgi:hypothetical protein